MLRRGAILLQHDIQVHHNRLQKVCGYARAMDLEGAHVFCLLVGFESNLRSNSLINCPGDYRAVVYAKILGSHIIRQILYNRPGGLSWNWFTMSPNPSVKSCIKASVSRQFSEAAGSTCCGIASVRSNWECQDPAVPGISRDHVWRVAHAQCALPTSVQPGVLRTHFPNPWRSLCGRRPQYCWHNTLIHSRLTKVTCSPAVLHRDCHNPRNICSDLCLSSLYHVPPNLELHDHPSPALKSAPHTLACLICHASTPPLHTYLVLRITPFDYTNYSLAAFIRIRPFRNSPSPYPSPSTMTLWALTPSFCPSCLGLGYSRF